MTNSISVVIPEIIVHDNRAVTTSIAVANYFQKRHDNVIDKIRSVMADCDPAYRLLNFKETSYTRENPNGGPGIATPMYELTRDAFVLIVMGFTGKKALQWKIDYINAFNAMEAELRKPVVSHAPASGSFAIITYFENNLPVSCRPLVPGENVMTFESFMEQVIRCGYVMLPCDEIGKMTLEEMQELVDKARKVRAHWDERSASLKKKYF